MAKKLTRLTLSKIFVRRSSWFRPSKDVCNREKPVKKLTVKTDSLEAPVPEPPKPACDCVLVGSNCPYPSPTDGVEIKPPPCTKTDLGEGILIPAPPFAPCPPPLPPPPEVMMPSAVMGNVGPYRMMTLLLVIPFVMALSIKVLIRDKVHHDRPPFVPYEYLYVRKKPFPWEDGNKSFFHNPHVNALPEGYEDDGHQHSSEPLSDESQ